MPSAPPLKETEANSNENLPSRPRQVRVPKVDTLEYLPSNEKKPLYLSLHNSDFFLNRECQIQINDINDTTLTLCCLRDHKCEKQKKSLKVMFREIGNKPKEPAIFFHLRMLHMDPSHINTIRQFLGTMCL